MGLAILWVLFFHSKISVPDFMLPVKFIKLIGYAGVDIFFLLSGFGVACSLFKDVTKKGFFIKRFVRVIPVFWVILSVYFVIEYIRYGVGFRDVLFSFVGLDFILFGDLKFWFIPAICICYLFTPFFNSLLLKKNTKYFVIILIVVLLVLLVLFAVLAPHLLIFITRVPIFLFGIYIGYNFSRDRNVKFLNSYLVNAIILLVSSISLVCVLIYTNSNFRWEIGLWWYPTIFLAYPLCFFTGWFLDKNNKLFSYPTMLLRVAGRMSLELYLIHNLFLYSTKGINIDAPETLMQFIYIVLSFILAWLANNRIELKKLIRHHL